MTRAPNRPHRSGPAPVMGVGLCLALLTSFVPGCASGPRYAEVSDSFPAVEASMGRIYFYRKGGFGGSARRDRIYLNGEKVGVAANGGFFFVDRPPGDYVVSCRAEKERSASFRLFAGQTVYIETVFVGGVVVSQVQPLVKPRAEAMEVLSSAKYIGDALDSEADAEGTEADAEGTEAETAEW